MCSLIVLDRFVVALQVLQDRGTVKVHIRIGFREVFLGLCVRFKGELKLFNALLVCKEVRKVSIAKYIYTSSKRRL